MDTNLLLSHADDLVKKAIKTGCSSTKFTSPAEAEIIKQYVARRNDVIIIAEGGYDNAERTRIIFLNPDWGNYERKKIIAALKINHHPQYVLGHRDILGALMNLGIKREIIGDIEVDSSSATIVCLPEFSGYITDNLTKVGRVGVTVISIPIDELLEKTENIKLKKVSVSSLRVDTVISAVFDISRNKATMAIMSGQVSVNHSECQKPDKELKENIIFSLRGYGRAKITEIGGKSRKGKLYIQAAVY